MAKFGLLVLASLALVSFSKAQDDQQTLKIASILVSVKMQKNFHIYSSSKCYKTFLEGNLDFSLNWNNKNRPFEK